MKPNGIPEICHREAPTEFPLRKFVGDADARLAEPCQVFKRVSDIVEVEDKNVGDIAGQPCIV